MSVSDLREALTLRAGREPSNREAGVPTMSCETLVDDLVLGNNDSNCRYGTSEQTDLDIAHHFNASKRSS